MDLTVIKTAILNGASACNYLNVENIQKVNDIYELTIFDKETQKVFKTKAKFVVNATGPYTDGIRKMIDPSAQEICKPSTGIHLSMPKNMTDHNVGILINESHNRVLFVLPWEGTTIVGTTDTPATIQERPLPTKKELESVLDRLSVIIDKNITTINNVKSCWSGIRPLVIDPNATKGDTASISRSHLIQQTGNFITISGGKWTIFRKMGKDVVDKISGTKSNDSEPDVELKLYNCIDWTPQVTQQLIEKFKAPEDIAKHLSRSFGVEALDIANIRGGFNRLHPEYPYTEEELIHICKNEYVCSLEDIISRRTRLAFIDVPATIEILDKVSNIVKSELKWSDNKVQIELEKCKKFLNEDMGYDLLRVKTQ
ncbi:putative glycerol-3-phosphate dehydrogenase, mitochondrial [Thelohanellus kitauei]|uniref:glycerol-3-phosphate dehydrogenase n=1 Tax=Thelohanellus kitauei TaxID=669202 RepID=A0A0C2N8U7_THEKT|nr:putative glycerol-3-phosphate dehydrogenase, mitochondrial [Thelohanellus kitauei]